MSELALAASRKVRLTAMADAGTAARGSPLTLLANPNQFLSTVQVGITSIGVLNGMWARPPSVRCWRNGAGPGRIGERPLTFPATALVVTLITFITIIFGDWGPSASANSTPSRWAQLGVASHAVVGHRGHPL